MVFTSATFLIFLAVVFAVYWLLQSREQQNLLLLVSGYIFYAWWDYRFCSLMLLSTVVDYVCGRGCVGVRYRRVYLVASLISNLGMLGLFKYFNFFQESLITSMSTLGVHVNPFSLQLVLPLGISFYTFQTLSYTIDAYRRKIEPHNNFIDYAAYVSFFPQLVAGPIERASALLPQFSRDRKFDAVLARDGLRQMLWGFFKKMAIADRLSVVVEEVYRNSSTYDSGILWVAAICFSFQIYCDFSAYSDIAIGTARLFGFELTRNFATPYFSQDFVEFWRRWHITLSTWFRDYLYVPLGGNRQGRVRQHVNVMIVFAVSGLWHGAGWNYVLWGVIHGFMVVVSSIWRRHPLTINDTPLGNGLHPIAWLRALGVFFIACLAWVFFRVTNFGDACDIVYRMVFFQGCDLSRLSEFVGGSLQVVQKLLPIMLSLEFIARGQTHPLKLLERVPKFVRWFVYMALIWATMYYMPEESGEFVYFQF